MQTTASLTSLSSAEAESTRKGTVTNQQQQTTTTAYAKNNNANSSRRLLSFMLSFLLVAILSVSVLEFSQWLPFNIPGFKLLGVSDAAIHTYEPAWYNYDNVHTKFDNTHWTYGTDYVLTAVMFFLAYKCWMAQCSSSCSSSSEKKKNNKDSIKLRAYSASLLLCYGISTFAGGYSHQTFTSIDSLNTLKFRLFWIICVGNVSFASCYMGLIGREVQKVFGVRGRMPLGPWWFWPVYGTYMVATCAMGYISFKRPACDIFIAGSTQFPSTFYCLGALGLRKWNKSKNETSSPIGYVRLPYRLMYYIGFIGNAPLLPMYPLLVQYSGLSLAGINTLLHTCLMVMWGMQGISLLHLCNAMSSHKQKIATE